MDMGFSVPEKEGVCSSWISNFVKKLASKKYVHSFTIARNSKILASGSFPPYSKNYAHHLFSGTKTLTSMAFGIIYDRKMIELDAKVLPFFPEIKVDDPKWEKLTVRHLLTMSSGHGVCPMFSAYNTVKRYDFVKIFFETPLQFEPGKKFTYNTCATYIISEIIKRASNKDMEEWLQEVVFSKLGIKDISFIKSESGVSIGGVGCFIKQDDWAKIGQLMLNYGKWNGEQLISDEYMRAMLTKQVETTGNGSDSNWCIGYGFQTWVTNCNGMRADGAYGQYNLIYPEVNLMVSIQSGMDEMGSVMVDCADELVKKLSADDKELAENPQEYDKLQQLIASLKIPALEDETNESSLKNCTYSCDFMGIKELEFIFSAKKSQVNIKLADNRAIIWEIGMGEYLINEFSDLNGVNKKFAVCGRFLQNGGFEIQAFDLNNVYRMNYICHFKNGEVEISRNSPFSLLNPDWQSNLVGKLID